MKGTRRPLEHDASQSGRQIIGLVAGSRLETSIETVARIAPIQYKAKYGWKYIGAEAPEANKARPIEIKSPKTAVPPPSPIRNRPIDPCPRNNRSPPVIAESPPSPTSKLTIAIASCNTDRPAMPMLEPTWLSRYPRLVNRIEPEEIPLAIKIRPATTAMTPALLRDRGTDIFNLACAFLTVTCNSSEMRH